MALLAHALQAVQIRLNSVSNEGHFTLEAEKLFRPYLPSHCSGVNEICHMELLVHALGSAQVRLKSVVMKTILLSMQKNLFVHTSHIIAVG
jgi:hypothetical protein